MGDHVGYHDNVLCKGPVSLNSAVQKTQEAHMTPHFPPFPPFLAHFTHNICKNTVLTA
jgi:hypothetical protein